MCARLSSVICVRVSPTVAQTNRLLCEVHSLKAKLDRFPMVSQLDKELHILKAQLADLRLSHTAEAISPLDSNRLAELWSELQALISANRNGRHVCVVIGVCVLWWGCMLVFLSSEFRHHHFEASDGFQAFLYFT